MKILKRVFVLFFLLLLVSCGAKTGDKAMNVLQISEFWYTDYVRSLEIAKKEKKRVVLYFGGSNWCPPCKKLRKDVFGTEAFKKNIKKEFVLLDIDFQIDGEQKKDLKVQNRSLLQEYQVYNFPTMFILNSEGEVIDKISGYGSILKDRYIKVLNLGKYF